MKPGEFWNLTLYEIWIEVTAWEREREELALMLRATAWHTANLSRSRGRLPNLKKWLGQRKPVNEEEVVSIAQDWPQKKEYWEGIANRLARDGKL